MHFMPVNCKWAIESSSQEKRDREKKRQRKKKTIEMAMLKCVLDNMRLTSRVNTFEKLVTA